MKKKPLKYKDLSGETFLLNDPHERAHALNTLHVTSAVRSNICLAPQAMTPFSSTLSLTGYRELFLKNIVASRKKGCLAVIRLNAGESSAAASVQLPARHFMPTSQEHEVISRHDSERAFEATSPHCFRMWQIIVQIGSCVSPSQRPAAKTYVWNWKSVFPPKELVFCSVRPVLLPLASLWFSLVCYDKFQQHTNNNRARFKKCVGWSEDFLKSYLFFFFLF